jgi:hypothetical protein
MPIGGIDKFPTGNCLCKSTPNSSQEPKELPDGQWILISDVTVDIGTRSSDKIILIADQNRSLCQNIPHLKRCLQPHSHELAQA